MNFQIKRVNSDDLMNFWKFSASLNRSAELDSKVFMLKVLFVGGLCLPVYKTAKSSLLKTISNQVVL